MFGAIVKDQLHLWQRQTCPEVIHLGNSSNFEGAMATLGKIWTFNLRRASFSDRQLLLLGSVFTITLTLLIVLMTIFMTWRRNTSLLKNTRPALKRNVSFTSSILAAKVIPENANLPDAVINAVILFEKRSCPTDEDVLEQVVKKMLKYERLSAIPVLGKDERLSFEPGSYDPKDLIRRLQVDDNDDSSLYATIRKHIHDALNDPKQRGYLPWWEIMIIEVGFFFEMAENVSM